ncbi:MAG: FlgD immunoglobulin-like domain containing protein, partial [Elusimicrobiota bacterium]
YYSDIVSRRFIVDSFKPVMPAAGEVKDEAAGVKISWPDAVTGPSGLAYYAVEERSGTGPVWTRISTTTALSLIIAKSGLSPSSLSRPPGTYFYRVSAVNNAGVAGEPTAPLSVNIDLGLLPAISHVSAYPNPFDSRSRSVTLNFTLSRAAEVQVSIYTVFGSRIRSFSLAGAAGANETVWDGADDSGRKVSKGMYICVIKAAGIGETVKIGVIH